jgi:hypothetical protein
MMKLGLGLNHEWTRMRLATGVLKALAGNAMSGYCSNDSCPFVFIRGWKVPLGITRGFGPGCVG